ncbi:MAG: ABC transporter permease [Anaerolineae bacterium]|nr:ABC transporter permease [Anaerolineae bacterium]
MTAEAPSRPVAERGFRTQGLQRNLRGLLRLLAALFSRPTSALGTAIVLVFLFLAFFGEQVAPYPDPNDQSHAVFEAPTLELGRLSLGDYPFGTDRLGRDVFSRVILGAASIFRVAGLGTGLAVVAGTVLGLLMGYQGGLFDEVLGRVIDAMLAIPALLLALVAVGIIRQLNVEPGTWQAELAENAVLLVIGILYLPIVARVVRSVTLDIKTREFIEAAQIRGESRFYIIFREILPSVVPALVVEASLRFSYAIFLVASLGFLGFGIRPPSPDWGRMVSEARSIYRLAPWALEYPAGAIAALVVGVNLMSDGIKRALQKSA